MTAKRWRCSAEPTTRPRLSGNLSRVLDVNLFSIFNIYLFSGQVNCVIFIRVILRVQNQSGKLC